MDDQPTSPARKRLEGALAEERLAALRHRFSRLNPRVNHQSRRRVSALPYLCVATFAGVVAAGLWLTF